MSMLVTKTITTVSHFLGGAREREKRGEVAQPIPRLRQSSSEDKAHEHIPWHRRTGMKLISKRAPSTCPSGRRGARTRRKEAERWRVVALP